MGRIAAGKKGWERKKEQGTLPKAWKWILLSDV